MTKQKYTGQQILATQEPARVATNISELGRIWVYATTEAERKLVHEQFPHVKGTLNPFEGPSFMTCGLNDKGQAQVFSIRGGDKKVIAERNLGITIDFDQLQLQDLSIQLVDGKIVVTERRSDGD